jgi:hypothetical protein
MTFLAEHSHASDTPLKVSNLLGSVCPEDCSHITWAVAHIIALLKHRAVTGNGQRWAAIGTPCSGDLSTGTPGATFENFDER